MRHHGCRFPLAGGISLSFLWLLFVGFWVLPAHAHRVSSVSLISYLNTKDRTYTLDAAMEVGTDLVRRAFEKAKGGNGSGNTSTAGTASGVGVRQFATWPTPSLPERPLPNAKALPCESTAIVWNPAESSMPKARLSVPLNRDHPCP